RALVDATDIETIEFAKDESTLFFRIGPRLLTSRQLTGQFPNFEAVLPKDNNKSVTLHGEDLSAAISRVAQFADERSRAVRLRLEKDELKLSASSAEMGESEDAIETSYNGETLTIGFNAQYILDFLKAVGAGDVKLELKYPQSAVLLRSANIDDFKYRYVVMPMRILFFLNPGVFARTGARSLSLVLFLTLVKPGRTVAAKFLARGLPMLNGFKQFIL